MTEERVRISEFCFDDMPLSCTWIIVGPPGSGKCLAENTPVLLFDGRKVLVQDLSIGDVIMGDDNTPRTILSTFSGTGPLYTITGDDGTTFTVNESHILVLKFRFMPKLISQSDKNILIYYKNGVRKIFTSPNIEILSRTLDNLRINIDFTIENEMEISVIDFLKLPDEERNKYLCFRTEFDLAEKMTEIEPYIRGYRFARPELFGSVTDEKYEIENDYLLNSISNRKELLAGIIDACGAILDNRLGFVINVPAKYLPSIKILLESLDYTLVSIDNYRAAITGRTLDTIPFREERNKKIVANLAYTSEYTFKIAKMEQDGKYFGFELDGNKRFLLGNGTVTHNTTFIENMAYERKHLYPVARVFMGTEEGYKNFCDIFHPLFVTLGWDQNEEEMHVSRQRTCVMENGKMYPGNYAVNILDDISDDPKIYKTKVFKGLFKLGSQHWAQICAVGSQYAIDMEPDIRKSVSFVALGREPEQNERRKLYENFGGMCGSFKQFCNYMDEITGDFTFLIIKKRSQSNKPEDCLFWYRCRKLKPWKFGCAEYRKWGDSRYNKDYIDKLF